MAAPQVFTHVEHVAIAAGDPQRLAEWYCAVLGFHTRISMDNGPGCPRTYLVGLGAGPLIEILPAGPGNKVTLRANTEPGLVHVAILVSDFDAAQASLEAAGARAEGGERQAPLGARVRFYRDPEGNLFHILFRSAPLPNVP
ncbi:MAG: VOC family protein [Planctomycetota bacterium]|nr:VOC family protein [Planctomycetota bacterium]